MTDSDKLDVALEMMTDTQVEEYERLVEQCEKQSKTFYELTDEELTKR